MNDSHGQLDSRVILVMGGARGIGYGIAERCAREGAHVVIGDRSEEREEAVGRLGAGGLQAFALPLDVRNVTDHERAMAAMMARFGRIDGLVYSAGIFPRASLLDTDEALWREVLDINLTGAFLACRAVVPHMAAQGGGAIVTIGSLHARRGSANLLAYAVSKGGLVTLTRNLAAAHAHDRIRVNCVHPGWVLSEGEMAIRGLAEGEAGQFAQETGKNVPMGRMQTADDVAGLVAYLISPAAEQVTGQVIAVDGGLGGLGFA